MAFNFEEVYIGDEKENQTYYKQGRMKMAFNEMNIEDMLCDMYDIRRMAKFTTFDQSPKDSNGLFLQLKIVLIMLLNNWKIMQRGIILKLLDFPGLIMLNRNCTEQYQELLMFGRRVLSSPYPLRPP